jgi:hypothetical protein
VSKDAFGQVIQGTLTPVSYIGTTA